MVQSSWHKPSSGVVKEGVRQHQLAAGHKRPKSPSLQSGGASWSYLDKIYPSNNDANTPYAPSMVFWEGQLCCLWADVNGTPFFACGQNEKGSWAHRNSLNSNPSPPRMTEGAALGVFGEVTQNLHAIIVNNQSMYHYRYVVQIDEKGQDVWQWIGGDALPAKSNHQPALLGVRGELICAFTVPNSNNEIYLSRWTPPQPGSYGSGTWSKPRGLGAETWGVLGLYIMDDVLHMTYAANNNSRTLLDSTYNLDTDTLTPQGFSFQQTEHSAYGCSVTSFDDKAWLAFQKNGDGSGSVLVCELDSVSGIWASNVPIHENSKDTPSIAVLDDVINCIYNAHNKDAGNLLLSQAPATTYPPDEWMSHVSSDTLWSQLSIPGTHDSYSKVGVPFAQTQTMSLTEQLDSGIRYFDFRLKYTNPYNIFTFEDLAFYHGPIWMAGFLYNALQDIDLWFNATSNRKNETIFVQISDEEDGASSSDTFRSEVRKQIGAHSRWVIGNQVLPLSQLRGKVQVLRRYNDTSFGIDVTQWDNNVTPNFTKTNADGVKYTIQDHWAISTSAGWAGVRDYKMRDMSATFNLSTASTDSSQIFLNFSSCAPTSPRMSPEMIAVGGDLMPTFEGVNETLRAYIRGLHPLAQRLGVVLMDYPEDPEEDLVQSIIQTNAFTQAVNTGVGKKGGKRISYPFA